MKKPPVTPSFFGDENVKSGREYEQERLILNVFEAIADAMRSHGITKADIAQALGTSRPHISQLFGGSRNATLRTVADLAFACDMRVSMTLQPIHGAEFIGAPARFVTPNTLRIEVETAEAPKSSNSANLNPLAA